MKGIHLGIFLLCAALLGLISEPVQASIGDIITVAGATPGFSGDKGLAQPYGVAVDSAGNLYVADYINQVIRKIESGTGNLSVVAGSDGASAFDGDDGPATAAFLSGPSGVAVDSAGNLYIADYFNNRIRKVTASTGIISTVAGNGTAGFAGDGAAATAASLNGPKGVAVDGAGNLYIADSNNHRVRKVTAGTGFISTVAGNGNSVASGDGAAATAAGMFPYGVAVDGSGNLYIADQSNHRVRMVAASNGFVSTIAGTGVAGFSGDGATATAAQLRYPYGVAVDNAGSVYIADYINARIRKVSAGIISTVAGNGTWGSAGDGAAATLANLNGPNGVAVDGAGNIFIADLGNNRIREVTMATVTTVPGAPTGVTAIAGKAQASVSFSAPASNGGSAITGYTVTSSPAGGTDLNAGSTATTHTVTGLLNGTPYSFTVVATNLVGPGAKSAASSPVTPAIPFYNLSLSFAGTGAGSVNGGMSCTKGGSCPAVPFLENTVVTLIPSPDSNSLFGGWSSACIVTGNNCAVTVSAITSVTATFNAAAKLQVGVAPYALLADAYAAAANSAVIQARSVVFSDGDFILNRAVSVYLTGGYDTAFNMHTGDTALVGKLLVRSGTVRVDGLIVR